MCWPTLWRVVADKSSQHMCTCVGKIPAAPEKSLRVWMMRCCVCSRLLRQRDRQGCVMNADKCDKPCAQPTPATSTCHTQKRWGCRRPPHALTAAVTEAMSALFGLAAGCARAIIALKVGACAVLIAAVSVHMRFSWVPAAAAAALTVVAQTLLACVRPVHCRHKIGGCGNACGSECERGD